MRRFVFVLGFVVALAAGAVWVGAHPGTASATQAAPGVQQVVHQPDGTPVRLTLWGDEFANGWETADGYTVVKDSVDGYWKFAERDGQGRLRPSNDRVGHEAPRGPRHLRPSQAAIDEARQALGAPPLGVPYAESAPPWADSSTHVLLLMVQFSDVTFAYTRDALQAGMFGTTASGPSNLAEYYNTVSGGMFQMLGDVAGPVTLTNKKDHYNSTAGGAAALVAEAVALADPSVNFKPYDNDANGVVDDLVIIYAGGGPHDGCYTTNPDPTPNELWPHSGGAGAVATDDAVTINPYIINSGTTSAYSGPGCQAMQTIGLIVHEFGHALGMPDLYDTSKVDMSEGGVGSWSPMASEFSGVVAVGDAPGIYDPWNLWFEGWITPTERTGQNQGFYLEQYSSTRDAVQLLPNPAGVQIGGTGEYFLVVNRERAGLDVAMPSCGTLIWHVDEAQTSNQVEGHRLVQLMQADGLGHLDIIGAGGNRGDTGDPYPGSTGNRSFTDATTPSAHFNNGTASGVRVQAVGGCDSTVPLNIGAAQAELGIGVSDMPDPVLAGRPLRYSVTVTNPGPGHATDVMVVDTIPTGVTFLTSSIPCTLSAGKLSCPIGTILVGGSYTFTLDVAVPANLLSAIPATTVELTNTAVVSAAQLDPDTSDNTMVTPTMVLGSADLELTKICLPGTPVPAGEKAACTFQVVNGGPSNAAAVVVTDAITAGAPVTVDAITVTPSGSCVPAAPAPSSSITLTCNLGTIGPSAKASVAVSFTTQQAADVKNIANVASGTPDPNTGNDTAQGTVSFISAADLSVTKTTVAEALAGTDVTFSIAVANAGPSPALAVVVKDLLPVGLSVLSVTPSVGSCIPGVPGDASQPLTCNLGNLAKNASATIAVRVHIQPGVAPGTILSNGVSVGSPTYDPAMGNNSASAAILVTNGADLVLTKSAVGVPIAGTAMSYLYSLANLGPSEARGVALHDVLPPSMTFVSAFQALGGVATGPPLPCDLVSAGTNEWSCLLGTIGVTGSSPLQFIVNVGIAANVPTGTHLLNSASVTSTTPDLDPATNAASAEVVVLTRADLAVSLTSNADTYKPSSTVVYTITVTNVGPSDSQDVVVTSQLPITKQAIYKFDSGGCVKAGLTLTCSLGSIAAGTSKSFNIYVVVKGSKGEVTSTASVASSTPDPVVANNTSTRKVLIKGGM
jgi:M6 family metalloprotease-like protein/uncharacterized repeat protein (TIGR01451 family)